MIKWLKEKILNLVFRVFSCRGYIKVKTLKSKLRVYSLKLKLFDLVRTALNAEPTPNKFVAEFGDLIEKKYKNNLCEKERFSNSAVNLSKLDGVYEELQRISHCHELHSKSIGAVGGGFSSGKSTFINSFFSEKDVWLATGTTPVTVIPSYVISNEKTRIEGISNRGGNFDIEVGMYKTLKHDTIKSLDFNFKEIIRFTTVLTPLRDDCFKNLCLIDTPGYNPPNSGNTKHDYETARRYIKDAKFLVWLVGLGENGTIPQSDIDFLNALDFGKPDSGKQLYIVANKADVKTPDDIESILDVFEETLDDNDFNYEGISAYSFAQGVHTHRKKDVMEFFKEHNKPSQIYGELKNIIDEVFDDHKRDTKEHAERREKMLKKMNSIKNDLFRVVNPDDDDTGNKVYHKLQELQGLLKNIHDNYPDIKGGWSLWPFMKDPGSPEQQEMRELLKNIDSNLDNYLKNINSNVDPELQDVLKNIDNKVDEVYNYFKPEKEKSERLKNIDNVKKKFMDCLNGFCNEFGIDRTVVEVKKKDTNWTNTEAMAEAKKTMEMEADKATGKKYKVLIKQCDDPQKVEAIAAEIARWSGSAPDVVCDALNRGAVCVRKEVEEDEARKIAAQFECVGADVELVPL